MRAPQLIFIAGCNAAGKSTFIRTRLSELSWFEVIMTDVYKERTREIFDLAVKQKKDIIIETVFNDASFKDLVDNANNAGYDTSLIVLFLDNLQQSNERVALRGQQGSGITISGSNVKINFQESFKNIANYFMYFNRSEFIFTGVGGKNKLIMSFKNEQLMLYISNELAYPQKFASYSFSKDRIDQYSYNKIVENKDFIEK